MTRIDAAVNAELAGLTFNIMEHAVYRYIERVGPRNLGHRRARSRLYAAIMDATIERPPWDPSGSSDADLWLRCGDFWLPCRLERTRAAARYKVTTVLV